MFVVIEPTGASARKPASRMAWACVDEMGVAPKNDFPRAASRIAALASQHPLHLADPLFDEPRLTAMFAAVGLGAPPPASDWLLALAPFKQAKHLAAILEVAEARAEANNPAATLLEAWREAATRAMG